MSWIVPFNGRDLECDPGLIDGIELGLIKRNTGLSTKNFVLALADLDGEAWRALFWIVERRDDDSVKFSDYRGPSLELIMEYAAGLQERIEYMAGKGLASQTATTTGTTGTPTSPNGDGTEPSISL